MERFGEYARKRRERQRISLRSLAEKLSLSAPYLSDIERGNRNPPGPDVVGQWATLIGEDIQDFVRRADLDRRVVEIPVNHNLANAELALAFARRIDELSDDTRSQIWRLLGTERKQGE